MKIFITFLVILLAGLAMGVVSFDRDRNLIEDAVLVREPEQKFIQLDFSAPVRLVGNHPETRGDILQVKLRVIGLGEFDENFSILEKYIGTEEGKEIYMTDMQYEGDVPGGPFLVLRFNRPVIWEITEGDGLLGMHIVIKKA